MIVKFGNGGDVFVLRDVVTIHHEAGDKKTMLIGKITITPQQDETYTFFTHSQTLFIGKRIMMEGINTMKIEFEKE